LKTNIYASSKDTSILTGSFTKYGETKPLLIYIPSTRYNHVSIVLESSILITPSIPDYLIAIEIMFPISVSLFEDIVAILAISFSFEISNPYYLRIYTTCLPYFYNALCKEIAFVPLKIC